MKWVFEPAGRVRRGGNAAAYAFRPDLSVFVREVVQNAKDQKRSDVSCAKVHFALLMLRARSLERFLEALRWEELQDHLRAAADQTQHAAFLRRAIEKLETNKQLLLLRVDDSGTGGLVGADLEKDKPFTSLCIDELFSAKNAAGAGGSYGLGKSVLWRFSGLSTVLFSSILRGEDYREGQEGLRLFGRTQLPWHSVGNKDYDGPCWLGRPTRQGGQDVALSAWESETSATARALHLDRVNAPGTSILIVDFNPPAEEGATAAELCRRMCQAASRDFWPVLAGDGPELEVTAEVRDLETGERECSAKAGITDEVKPFVACLASFREAKVVEEIVNPDDVAAESVPIKIPGLITGEPAIDAIVTVCVRLVPSGRALTNHVAYARGFGMVVKYRNLDGISLSARPFAATLLCGTLRGNSEADQATEQFLRMAEPPEHNTWAPNQRLQSNYRKGYATQLEQLDKKVSAAIKALVSQAAGEGDHGPRLLSRMFPIGEQGGARRKHGFAMSKRKAVLAPGGEWLFGAEVRRTEGTGPWRVRVALRFGTDDGAEGSVVRTLEKLKPAVPFRVEKGTAIVDVPETCDRLVLQGRSDLNLHPVDSRRAAVRLDVSAGASRGDGDVTEPEEIQ